MALKPQAAWSESIFVSICAGVNVERYFGSCSLTAGEKPCGAISSSFVHCGSERFGTSVVSGCDPSCAPPCDTCSESDADPPWSCSVLRITHGETRETRAWTPHENLRELWKTHLDSRVYLSGIWKRGVLRDQREERHAKHIRACKKEIQQETPPCIRFLLRVSVSLPEEEKS